jgi:hypothetical protein
VIVFIRGKKADSKSLQAALGFFESGASCQAALHGCLPAENVAIHIAAIEHTGIKPVARSCLSASPQPVLFPERTPTRGVFRLCSAGPFAGYLHFESSGQKEQNPWLA